MSLTPAQLATLKAAILADPVLSALPMTSGGALVIAESFNAPAAPSFIVWRSTVTDREIMLNGFDWARVDNLSVGKARIWDWLFRFGSIDPSKTNVRAGIDATWVGTAADLAVRAAVYVHCKRAATKAEKLFASGTGSDATPAVAGFEGMLSADDVQQARELP
jgi:hypothetical protein